MITGGGGRRRWSDAEKSRAVEASLEPEAVVSEVARHHGVTPQQLFTWRREARRRAAEIEAPPFVPAVVAPRRSATTASGEAESEATGAPAHVVELDIGGSSVWIWPGADAAMVRAVIGALKGR